MEGSIKVKKTQAMKKYKRAKFLYNFILYSLTSIITCLFFSYSFWFPSMMHLLLALSNNVSLYFNGKCFFIVGNLIVLILVRELKSARSSYSSPVSDMYDEYRARSQSYREASPSSNIYEENFARSWSCRSSILAKEKEEDGVMQIKKNEEKRHGYTKNVGDEEKQKEMKACKSMHHKQKKEGMRKCKSEVWGESEIEKRKQTNGIKEVQLHISRDELNERVEAFIARVNKQRLLESNMLDHSRG